MYYLYITPHSHQPFPPLLPSFLSGPLVGFLPCPPKGAISCVAGRETICPLLHFVNSFPRGAIRLPRPSTSRFYFSLILPFVPCFSRFPLRHPVRSPISFSLSPLLSLSGYPAERARYPFRADIPWRIPGTKAATIPREYVGETRNVKRARPLLHPALPSSSASAYPIVSPSLSFPVSPSVFLSLLHRIYLYLVLSYHLPPIATTFFPSLALSLSRSFSIPVPRILPVHQKVVVLGMRLIPREYQEPSKRTEVG